MNSCWLHLRALKCGELIKSWRRCENSLYLKLYTRFASTFNQIYKIPMHFCKIEIRQSNNLIAKNRQYEITSIKIKFPTGQALQKVVTFKYKFFPIKNFFRSQSTNVSFHNFVKTAKWQMCGVALKMVLLVP